MNKAAVGLYLFSVFTAACSQVLLRHSAKKTHASGFREYWNGWVIGAYFLLLCCTLMTIQALRSIPLNTTGILESTMALYILLFDRFLFRERITRMKLFGNLLIVSGIFVYFSNF